MKKTILCASLLAAFAALPGAAAAQTAAAQEAKSPHTFTGNMNFVNEYRYRGLAQTGKKPALQGGFDYAHESGFYVGVWGSNVSWISAYARNTDGAGAADASLEVDIYGGYKGSVEDFGYDVGLLQYWYPGSYALNTSVFKKPNTLEAYVAGSWKTVTLKYSHATTDLFGTPNSKGSGYVDLTGTYDLGDGYTLSGHVGRQIIKNSGAFSYTDYKVGVSKDALGLTWTLSYVDTNADKALYTVGDKVLSNGTALLSVGKTF